MYFQLSREKISNKYISPRLPSEFFQESKRAANTRGRPSLKYMQYGCFFEPSFFHSQYLEHSGQYSVRTIVIKLRRQTLRTNENATSQQGIKDLKLKTTGAEICQMKKDNFMLMSLRYCNIPFNSNQAPIVWNKAVKGSLFSQGFTASIELQQTKSTSILKVTSSEISNNRTSTVKCSDSTIRILLQPPCFLFSS